MSKLITGSSLIIGVLLIGIFNFLVPGNSDAFTENVTEINAFTENLGSNKENAQIFFIIIGLGLIFFLNGILGIYKGIGDREKNIKGLAITLNIVAIVMFLITLGIANAFADSAEMNMIAYQISNQAGMAAQSGDPAAMEQYNLASINSIIAGAASGGVYAVYWGVFAVATYVIYIATAATGYIIIKSGNHYLTPLMNSIVGYGLLGLGPIFLVLGLIWKVNTEIGYRIFNVSQILWVILILILGIMIINHNWQRMIISGDDDYLNSLIYTLYYSFF